MPQNTGWAARVVAIESGVVRKEFNENVTVGEDLKEVRRNIIPWQELMQQPGTGT